MVESLRKLVSGNRRRFTDEEYSLDLTYIVPNRIIAMSYPSSGFESLYRNPIEKVREDILLSLLNGVGIELFDEKSWRQILHHKHI